MDTDAKPKHAYSGGVATSKKKLTFSNIVVNPKSRSTTTQASSRSEEDGGGFDALLGLSTVRPNLLSNSRSDDGIASSIAELVAKTMRHLHLQEELKLTEQKLAAAQRRADERRADNGWNAGDKNLVLQPKNVQVIIPESATALPLSRMDQLHLPPPTPLGLSSHDLHQHEAHGDHEMESRLMALARQIVLDQLEEEHEAMRRNSPSSRADDSLNRRNEILHPRVSYHEEIDARLRDDDGGVRVVTPTPQPIRYTDAPHNVSPPSVILFTTSASIDVADDPLRPGRSDLIIGSNNNRRTSSHGNYDSRAAGANSLASRTKAPFHSPGKQQTERPKPRHPHPPPPAMRTKDETVEEKKNYHIIGPHCYMYSESKGLQLKGTAEFCRQRQVQEKKKPSWETNRKQGQQQQQQQQQPRQLQKQQLQEPRQLQQPRQLQKQQRQQQQPHGSRPRPSSSSSSSSSRKVAGPPLPQQMSQRKGGSTPGGDSSPRNSRGQLPQLPHHFQPPQEDGGGGGGSGSLWKTFKSLPLVKQLFSSTSTDPAMS